MIGNNVFAGLNQVSCDRTFSHSWLSSQDEEPLVFLLKPVVYVIEDVRSSCDVFGELLEIWKGDRC
jgi:hypothetical protein